MKKGFFTLAVLSLSIVGATTHANQIHTMGLGFSAPTVNGVGYVTNVQTGEIAFDAADLNFKGFDGTNWVNLGGAGSSALTIVTILSSSTTSYSILSADDVVNANANSAAITLSLPAAASVSGKEIKIKKTDNTTNLVTINAASGDSIGPAGISSRKLATEHEGLTLVSDGDNWTVVSHEYDRTTKSYTLTISGLGTGGATVTALGRREGDSIRFEGKILKDASPGSGSANVVLGLPSGISVNTSKVANSAMSLVGNAQYTTATFPLTVTSCFYDGTTGGITFNNTSTGNYFRGGDFGAGFSIFFNFTVPVTNWEG